VSFAPPRRVLEVVVRLRSTRPDGITLPDDAEIAFARTKQDL
jgi:hypothetical protein